MANHNVNVEINKQLAGVVAFACLIAFGTSAFVFEWWNPLLAAGVAAVIGYAIAYADKGGGLFAVVVAVIVFVVAVQEVSG